ncbi:hypothetical protein BJP40_01075 [Streptomyces sp. CC53]|uniref:DUF6302 family protein n=1 Tax=Streptomyces sp. CC53 TaxID=1906740 RepID=UPI0008DE6633|nr:DUF6302 family protein [Streptomyces sp. CC53]OII65520.1 hypothetical protein BJP40_01075 [Streptomyces sp. CC53]
MILPGSGLAILPCPSPAGPALGVRILAPEEACDYEYVAARLVRIELMLGAVAVALHRLAFVAVPAGAGRRGGRMGMLDPAFAELTARALRGRPGFHGVTAGGTHVSWGEPVPAGMDADARRQFFGLRRWPREQRLLACQREVLHA